MGKYISVLLFILGPLLLLFIASILLKAPHFFSSYTQNAQLTPQEINAKECKKMVEATFEKLTFQSEWLRKESVTSCINMMDENYKNGLPNYATNSPEEMQNFWEVKRKKELVDLRGKHKDKIEEIAHNCAESTFKIYTILFSNKMRGKSKEEQIKFLKAAPNSTTILDSILIRLSYEAIDDIYSGTGPTNNDEAAKRIVFFNNMCKELYEKSVLLR